MTIEALTEIILIIVRWTLFMVCVCFVFADLVLVWRCIISILMDAFFYFFPGLKNRRKKD